MKRKRFGFLVMMAFAAACSGQALAVTTGQYNFDGDANDSSGFGRNGTLVGSPTFTGGLYQGSASSLLLNGSSQSVQLPDATDFIRNAPGATLMAWVRPDVIGSGAHTIMVVNNADATQNGGLGSARANLQINGGQFRALGRMADTGSSSTVSAFTPTIGTSYFVAGVFEYTTGAIRLYVNGAQVGSTTTTGWAGNSADTANPVARIGANYIGAAEYFNGAIDGARLFDNALTASEILALYNAESFPPPMPGDTDGNGVVELADLTPIRTNWRLTGKTRIQGNLSGDTAGLVDFTDFRQWKTAYVGGGGSLDGIDLSFAAVPEPSTLLLVALATGLCGRRRRS